MFMRVCWSFMIRWEFTLLRGMWCRGAWVLKGVIIILRGRWPIVWCSRRVSPFDLDSFGNGSSHGKNS